MIQGPLTGATDSEDSASASDLATLTAVVTTNTATISTKADDSALTIAEGTISTHTGQIASLNNSYNNRGNSFYTKVLTDGLLTAKQNVIGAGDLTIDRTATLQATLDSKAAGSELVTAQGTISTHTSEIAALGSSKQATLSNNGGSGIGLLNGVEVRQVTAVAPLSATILYDFANPSDPNNNNVELNVDLSNKQDTIADGDLTIAKTNGLQSAINGKQDTITDGSLSISKTNGLQTAINGKQPSITTATFAPTLTTCPFRQIGMTTSL